MNTQLVDYSPPNGDYVRYIDQLMQRSQNSAALQKTAVEQGSVPAHASSRPSAPGAPGQTAGPPELAELMRKVFKKSGLTPSSAASNVPVVAVWWVWVAVALVIAGVLLPMGIGWIAVAAFALWRVSKVASKAASQAGSKAASKAAYALNGKGRKS